MESSMVRSMDRPSIRPEGSYNPRNAIDKKEHVQQAYASATGFQLQETLKN